jgi:RimJ/RimL family protein N-acetyltransferase
MRLDLGDGIVVRPYRDSDIESLVAQADNPNVSRNLEDRFPNPYTIEDAKKYLAEVARQDPITSFAIADQSGVIGGIGIRLRQDVYRITAELGYWLGENPC